MMKHSHLQNLFKTLNEEGLRYVVVGGLAVNFHGYQRFTKDVDMMVCLDSDALEKMVSTLKKLGFSPIHPIAIEAFCDENNRAQWVKERNMTVFSVVSDDLGGLTLDLFVENPYDFAEVERDLIFESMKDEIMVPTIDLTRLIQMKKAVGRPQDIIDVQALEKIQAEYLPTEGEDS